MMTDTTEAEFDLDYDRGMLRSELVSLFWTVISERKKSPDGYALQQLADKLGRNKSQVSRWFNSLPNWEANTVADIAGALGVDLQIVARDRRNGKIYTATGIQPSVETASTHLQVGPVNRPTEPKATGGERADGFTYHRIAA